MVVINANIPGYKIFDNINANVNSDHYYQKDGYSNMQQCVDDCNNDPTRCAGIVAKKDQTICYYRSSFGDGGIRNDEMVTIAKIPSRDFKCPTKTYPDKQTENLESCKDSINCLKDQQALNNRISEYNNLQNRLLAIAIEKYHARKRDFDNKLQEWTSMSGRYQAWGNKLNDYRNQTKLMNNCSYDVHNREHGKNTYFCARDFGEGWEHIGSDLAGCAAGLENKGICRRNGDKAYADFLREVDYMQVKPVFGESIPTKDQYPTLEQANTANIQCCNNMITVSGNTNMQDVVQSCTQKIEQVTQVMAAPTAQEEAKPAAPVPTSSKAAETKKAEDAAAQKAAEDSKAEEDKKAEDTDNNNKIIAGVVILIIFLILFSIFVSFGFVLMKK